MVIIGNQEYLTAEDILTAGATDFGSNLQEVITSYKKDINKLLSEVKWLYKYGGSGTGGGGSTDGNTSTKAWDIRVTLNGAPAIDGSIAKLSEAGNYVLELSVVRHGGGYYKYTITQGSKSVGRGTFTADDGKDYIFTTNLNCSNNAYIDIVVKNDLDDERHINFQYIVNVFSGEIRLVQNSGVVWNSVDEVLLSSAENNMFVDFSYMAALPVTVDFTVTDFNGKVYESSAVCTVAGNSVFLLSDLEGLHRDKYIPAYSSSISKPTTYKVVVDYEVFDELQVSIIKDQKIILVSIIPNTLFLSCTSDSVTIEDEEVHDGTAVIGSKPINIKIFNGDYHQSSYLYYYKFYYEDGTLLQEYPEETLLERVSKQLIFNCETPGMYYAVFYVRNVSSTEGYQYYRTIYWYVGEANASYSWYPKSTMETNSNEATVNYFRAGTSKGGFSSITGSYVDLSAASPKLVYTLNTSTAYSGRDLICTFGAQVNTINNENNPLLLLKAYDEYGAEITGSTISIYLNKVTYGENESMAIFIPREETSNKSNLDLYHLITLYKRYMESSGNDHYYEMVLYIDGIIELSFGTWTRDESVYTKCEICPANMTINYIEVTSIDSRKANMGQYEVNTELLYTDLDIAKHWYTYKYLIMSHTADAELRTRLENLSYLSDYEWITKATDSEGREIETSRIKVKDPGAIISLGKAAGVASMVLQVEPTTRFFNLPLFTWLEQAYDSGLPLKRKHPFSEEYLVGNSLDCLQVNKILFQEANTDTQLEITPLEGCEFLYDLQGSSTMGNFSKNGELGIYLKDADSDADIPVFSPNFNINDGNSFLPECSFTLKSDVVDSSHSNNTCLGDFINDNTTKFETYTDTPVYKNHIKLCLRGFPVLLYLLIPTNESANTLDISYDYYFLGIYNFNLGRGSDYNLGYKSARAFLDSNGNDTLEALTGAGRFIQTAVSPAIHNAYNEDLSVAEVLEKTEYFDFSQFNSTILFNTVAPMFGDFVPGLNTKNRGTLQLLVENVSKAGGYIFELLGKNFGDIHDAYHGVDKNGLFKNQVPDYKVLYKRVSDDDNERIYSIDEALSQEVANASGLSQEAGNSLLRNLIIGDAALNITPLLDYKSIVEYYVICMAFGLVDSVLKNLNLKSFHSVNLNGVIRALYYAAFYDMDTSLNLGNQGEDISYFAFSDYWHSTVGTEGIISRSLTNVYRDFYPHNVQEIGYDVPSSYLFAIAKYAKLFLSELTTSPREIWASWRKKGGVLETALKFLNEYYNSHMKNINEMFFNLDYRAKYFIPSRTFTSLSVTLDSDNLKKLTGRRLAKVDWWLTKRFRILDAFFEVDGLAIDLYKVNYDESTNTVETKPDGSINWLKTNYKFPPISVSPINEDCKYFDTVFSTTYGGTYTIFAGTYNIKIKAEDYTPTTIIGGESFKDSYMFTDSNKLYEIIINAASPVLTKTYGSYFWTNVSNILPFVDSTGVLTIRSPFMLDVIGTAGTIKGFNFIDCYGLQTIDLTGTNYSGDLRLSNVSEGNAAIAYPLLTSIKLRNNTISLVGNSLYIKNLDIANKTGGTIDVSNSNLLTNVVFEERIGTKDNKPEYTLIRSSRVSILPYHQAVTELHNQAIENLTLRNTHPEASITITGDTALKTISLTGFKTVNISECPNIENITLVDVEHLSIHNIKATELNLKACPNIHDVDVSNCTNMQKVLINKEVRASKLTSMNISYTKIATLTWLNEDGTVDSGIEGEINLVGATGLLSSPKAFACSHNLGVKYVRFDNLKDDTLSPYLKDNRSKAITIGSFAYCPELLRVYGNVIVISEKAFHACPKFSIHGDNINNVTYNGKKVVNGSMVYMPYQLHTSNTEVVPKSLYFDGGTEDMDVYYIAGDNATNMSFDANLVQTFSNTACTLWDIHYVFSNANKVSSSLSKIALNETFAYFISSADPNNYGEVWTASAKINLRWQNYQLHRYLLHGVNLSSFSNVFRGNGSGSSYKRMWSPTKNGDTFKHDGFWDPIWSLNPTSFSWNYEGATTINVAIDNNFFVNAPLSVTSISGFFPMLVAPSNTNGIFTGSSTSFGTGDATALFDPLNNLTSLYRVGFLFLDFNTLTLPATITTLNYAIHCTYGTTSKSTGLNLNEIFPEESEVQVIKWESFYVSNANGNAGLVMFYLTDNTFDHLPYITTLGLTKDRNITNDTSRDSSFGGSGLTKLVDPANFPYDIFKGRDNLQLINGFFTGTMSTGGTDSIGLPGTLFVTNTKIKNISHCFYGLRFYYHLTSEGFANNTELNYMINTFNYGLFYYDTFRYGFGGSYGPNVCYLTGFIPKKFFYVKGTGTNGKRCITNISGCFANSNWDPYVETNPTSYWTFDGKHFNSAVTEAIIREYDDYYKTPSAERSDYAFKWVYDSDLGYASIGNYYEYCCCPDLLLYVSLTCIIDDLFTGCGSWKDGGTVKQNPNNYGGIGIGLKGRIPPYLFKDTNITKASGIFSRCKALSQYYLDMVFDEYNRPTSYKTHLIPDSFFKYGKISDISSMFTYNYISYAEDFSNVFKTDISLNCNNLFRNTRWINCVNAAASTGSACRAVFNYSGGIFSKLPINLNGMFSLDWNDERSSGENSYIQVGVILDDLVTVGSPVTGLFENYSNGCVTGALILHPFIGISDERHNYHYVSLSLPTIVYTKYSSVN